MKKMKQMISLMLASLLFFGMALPAQAEDMAEKIRKLTQKESTVSEPASVSQEESEPTNSKQSSDNTVNGETVQAVSEDETDDLNVEVITSRAAFTPDLMTASAGTKVYADSHLTVLLGVIKSGSVIYAVSLTESAVRIAFPSGNTVIEGYVLSDFLNTISKGSKASYALAANRGIKVYGQKMLSIVFEKASDSATVVPDKTATPTPKPAATVAPTVKPTTTPTVKATVSVQVRVTPTAKPSSTPTKSTSVPIGYPVVEEQPASASGVNGKLVVIYLKAKNTASYQWQYSSNQGSNWENLTNSSVWIGNRKSSLYFIPLAKYDRYMFRCKLTNSIGSVYSDAVQLSLSSGFVSVKPVSLSSSATTVPIEKPTATPTVVMTAKPTAVSTSSPTRAPSATVAITKPSFSVQPQSKTVAAGDQVNFSVSVANATLCQWQYSVNNSTWINLSEGEEWSGVQSENMSFTAEEAYNGYYFRLVASNTAGAVLSSSARLTVEASKTVSISVQPKDVFASAGEKVRFSIQALNVSSYQWYYCAASSSNWKLLSDSSVWSGSRTAELSFDAKTSYSGGRFRCLVSGMNATVTSDEVLFTFVTGAPMFDTSVDTAVKGVIGSYVTLTAKVSGATSCQWQINPNRGTWGDIRSDTDSGDLSSPSLTVKLLSSNLSYTYRLKATNAYGTTYSAVYTLGEMIVGPTNVKATAVGRDTIDVSWTASTDSRTRRYLVYYNTENMVDYSRYLTVTNLNARLTGLNAGTTYHIWVQAEGKTVSSVVDTSVHTSAVTYAPAAKPEEPGSVSVNSLSTTLNVSWKKPANSEVDGYVVYYRVYSSNSTQKIIVSGEDNVSVVLTGLFRNTSYQIWVTAFNEAGEGNTSSSIVTKTLAAAATPVQPTNVQASSVSSTSVKVSWTRSNSSDVKGYYVYYGTSTSVSAAGKLNGTYAETATSATITGLKAGTTYYFWVSAFNADGVESLLNTNVRTSAVPQTVSTSNKIDAVNFSKMGDKYIGTSYSVYDCQAFVEKMLTDAGMKNCNLAGSNAWYRQMSWRGTPEECKTTFGCIPTGAFLFIVKHDGGEPSTYRDNLGNANHIGVVTHRNGGAIHSSYSRGGVYTSVFNDATIPNGGWNMVGLWTRMDYGDTVNSILESLTSR